MLGSTSLADQRPASPTPSYIMKIGMGGYTKSDYTLTSGGMTQVIISTDNPIDTSATAKVNQSVSFTFTTQDGKQYQEVGTFKGANSWYINVNPHRKGYQFDFSVPVPNIGSKSLNEVKLTFSNFQFSTSTATYSAQEDAFYETLGGPFNGMNIVTINPGAAPGLLPEVPYAGLLPLVGMVGLGTYWVRCRRQQA